MGEGGRVAVGGGNGLDGVIAGSGDAGVGADMTAQLASNRLVMAINTITLLSGCSFIIFPPSRLHRRVAYYVSCHEMRASK
jgi:hypothetical protein